MERLRIIGKKTVELLITLLAIATFNFVLFRVLPGNPLTLIARAGHLTEEMVHNIESIFGLDKSLWEQYFIYLKNIATGQFGISITYRRPVAEVIGERFGNTLILLAAATVIVIVVGIGLGIVAAKRRGTKADRSLVVASMIGWSLPTFWTGLMMIIVFSVSLHWLPVSGITTPGAFYANGWEHFADVARHLVLPTISLVIVDMAQFFLVTRTSLVEVMTEDYMLTAKGKGLSSNKALWRYALPNAMLPIITTLTLYVCLVIGGAIQVETVFSYPGMGMLMYDAVLKRDYPILEASFFILAGVTILSNFISDIIYMYIDPRVKSL